MKTEVYTTMTYDEFDEIAKKLGRNNVEFVELVDASNDTSYTYNVDENEVEEFNAYEIELEEWEWRSAHTILTAAVAKGLVPAGNILVEVSW